MHKRWFLFFCLLFLLGAAIPAMAVYGEAPVTTNASDQVNPAISGQKVVWQDYRNLGYGCPTAQNCLAADIYYRNLSGGGDVRLTASSNAMDPDISGDRVAWRNWFTGKVQVCDINTPGSPTDVSTVNKQMVTPAISGQKVVWIDYRDSTDYGNIYIRDINQPTEQALELAPTDPTIPVTKKDKRAPDIDGNIVVWDDMRNAYQDEWGWWHNHDIYMKDLNTGIVSPVCTNIGEQYNPVISGNRIFWEDYRLGDSNPDIYMYDIGTGQELQVTTNSSYQTWPAADGNLVAWKDARDGNENIYMKNISTGVEEVVTANTSSQKIPAISGTTLAWMDKRNGNWDIYKASKDLAPPEVTSLGPSGWLNTSIVTVSATYSDVGAGIDTSSVQLIFGGYIISSCIAGPTQVDCPINGLIDGHHNYQLTVRDLDGNSVTANGTFDTDTQPPQMPAVSPSGWLTTNATNIIASYSDSGSGIDPDSVVVSLNGSALAGCTLSETQANCPVSGLSEGHYMVSVDLSDRVGYVNTGNGDFDVDTIGPVLGPLSYNAPDNSDTAVIDADIIDPNPGSGNNGATFSMSVDGNQLANCTSGGEHISCTATGLAIGNHSVLLGAADTAGNSSSLEGSFQLHDTVAPLITGMAPPTGEIDTADTTIHADYSDPYPGSGIDAGSVVVRLNGTIVPGCSISAAGVDCNVSNLINGQYLALVSVADNSGNPATSEWSFSVNSPGPVISNLRPANGALVNNPWPLIAADIDGNGADIDDASVGVYLDGADITSKTAYNQGSVSYTMTQGADPGFTEGSTHTARVVVSDTQGRTRDQSWSFTITAAQLKLSYLKAYWASNQDYTIGLLTVSYRMNNNGTGACLAGELTSGTATNGVIAYGPLPISLGDIAPATAVNYNFLYFVPPGVSSFISVSYARCYDDGGYTRMWPGPAPV